MPRDYSTFDKSVTDIRRAILREFQHNVDVGELLVQAVTAAQRQLDAREFGEYLTQSRPGSWEAALVERMIQPREDVAEERERAAIQADAERERDGYGYGRD